jgi:hypothetical protein
MCEQKYYQILKFNNGTVRVRNKPDFELIVQSLMDLYSEVCLEKGKNTYE